MTVAVVKPPKAAETSSREAHDKTVNVRMSSSTVTLIDTAAAVIGKSRSEFITESARLHAVDVLLDQRLFILGPEQFDAFEAALDKSPLPNAQLKTLLRSKPIWEK
jgi:uncharacterized protein (DUF1778 family)